MGNGSGSPQASSVVSSDADLVSCEEGDEERTVLTALPLEVLSHIVECLPRRHIGSVRLASQKLRDATDQLITRLCIPLESMGASSVSQNNPDDAVQRTPSAVLHGAALACMSSARGPFSLCLSAAEGHPDTSAPPTAAAHALPGWCRFAKKLTLLCAAKPATAANAAAPAPGEADAAGEDPAAAGAAAEQQQQLAVQALVHALQAQQLVAHAQQQLLEQQQAIAAANLELQENSVLLQQAQGELAEQEEALREAMQQIAAVRMERARREAAAHELFDAGAGASTSSVNKPQASGTEGGAAADPSNDQACERDAAEAYERDATEAYRRAIQQRLEASRARLREADRRLQQAGQRMQHAQQQLAHSMAMLEQAQAQVLPLLQQLQGLDVPAGADPAALAGQLLAMVGDAAPQVLAAAEVEAAGMALAQAPQGAGAGAAAEGGGGVVVAGAPGADMLGDEGMADGMGWLPPQAVQQQQQGQLQQQQHAPQQEQGGGAGGPLGEDDAPEGEAAPGDEMFVTGSEEGSEDSDDSEGGMDGMAAPAPAAAPAAAEEPELAAGQGQGGPQNFDHLPWPLAAIAQGNAPAWLHHAVMAEAAAQAGGPQPAPVPLPLPALDDDFGPDFDDELDVLMQMPIDVGLGMFQQQLAPPFLGHPIHHMPQQPLQPAQIAALEAAGGLEDNFFDAADLPDGPLPAPIHFMIAPQPPQPPPQQQQQAAAQQAAAEQAAEAAAEQAAAAAIAMRTLPQALVHARLRALAGGLLPFMRQLSSLSLHEVPRVCLGSAALLLHAAPNLKRLKLWRTDAPPDPTAPGGAASRAAPRSGASSDGGAGPSPLCPALDPTASPMELSPRPGSAGASGGEDDSPGAAAAGAAPDGGGAHGPVSEFWAAAAGLPQLEELLLRDGEVLDADREGIMRLTGLRKLRVQHVLNLPPGLSCLANLTRLTELVIEDLQYNAGAIHDEFCGLSRLTGLISLSFLVVGPLPAEVMAWRALTGLTKLEITNHYDENLVHCFGIVLPCLSRLVELHLSNFEINNALMEAVQPCRQLTSLRMGRCNVTEPCPSKMPQVRLLHLCLVDDLQVSDVALVRLFPGLQHLELLTRFLLSHASAARIPQQLLIAGPAPLGIRHLHLYDALLSTALPASCPTLESLQLLWSQSDMAMLLATLGAWSHLTRLEWSRCDGLQDSHMGQVVTALYGLKQLSLSGCDKLTDLGVAQLAAISGLTSLALGGCPQVSVVGLLPIVRSPLLASLELKGLRHISAAGVAVLEAVNGRLPFQVVCSP